MGEDNIFEGNEGLEFTEEVTVGEEAVISMIFTVTGDGDNKTVKVGHLAGDWENPAISKTTTVTAIRMPDTVIHDGVEYTVTAIGDYAFAELTNLQTVSMQSLTSIPSYGFAGATNLSSVSLPAVLAANGSAFSYGSALEVLELPNLTLLNSSPLLQNMTALKELRLPKNTSSLSGMISTTQNIELMDIGVTTTIGLNLNTTYFKKLEYLIMRNATTVCTPYSSTIFTSASPLGSGEGLILVPSSMVSSYKADAAWGAYAAQIKAIEDYPDICG